MTFRFPLVFVTLALAGATASAQVGGELRGRVSDFESGRPLPSATVEIVGRNVRTGTSPEGTFTIRGLDPRQYSVQVRAIGYAPRDTDVLIENGRTTTLSVGLKLTALLLDPIVARSVREQGNAIGVDREAIEKSGRRDLGELLQGMPGMVITQAGGPGSPSRISIRGSGSHEVLVLLDGTPINSAITGEADLSRIDLATVERVTVLRGAQSARYGPRALGGVVSIETRKARQEAVAEGAAGAWGEKQAGLTVGQKTSGEIVRFGGSVGADVRVIDGDFAYPIPAVRGGGTGKRLNGDSKATNFLATTSFEADSATAQLRAEWALQDRGTPGSVVQPSLTGRERNSRLSASFDARVRVEDAIWTLNFDAARERAVLVDSSPPFGVAYNDTIDVRTVGVSGAWTFIGPEPDSRGDNVAGTMTVGTEGRSTFVASSMLDSAANRWQQHVGAWGSMLLHEAVTRNVEMQLDLGLRGDLESNSDLIASSRAGLTLSRGTASISITASSAYAPPTLADQFFREGVQIRPNPDLRPEKVHHDHELRVATGDRRMGVVDAGGELALYSADIDGMIVWQPNFQFIWSPTSVNVHRSGWEASGHTALTTIGLDVHGGIARNNVTYVEPGLSGQVAYRPSLTANAAVGMSRWNTNAEISARYIGARRTVSGTDLNSLDPYWLAGLRISRPITSLTWRIEPTLGVENLFDRSTAMLVDYPFPGRAWTLAVRIRRGELP